MFTKLKSLLITRYKKLINLKSLFNIEDKRLIKYRDARRRFIRGSDFAKTLIFHREIYIINKIYAESNQLKKYKIICIDFIEDIMLTSPMVLKFCVAAVLIISFVTFFIGATLLQSIIILTAILSLMLALLYMFSLVPFIWKMTGSTYNYLRYS